jgi:serine/threonine-protein kinase
LLLSKNIFEADDEEHTRKNILTLDIPDFTEMRSGIDSKFNDILQLGLKRKREERYQSAQNMLTTLERFLYGDGYGPTNEKLAVYMKDLFGDNGESAALRWSDGTTPGL